MPNQDITVDTMVAMEDMVDTMVDIMMVTLARDQQTLSQDITAKDQLMLSQDIMADTMVAMEDTMVDIMVVTLAKDQLMLILHLMVVTMEDIVATEDMVDITEVIMASDQLMKSSPMMIMFHSTQRQLSQSPNNSFESHKVSCQMFHKLSNNSIIVKRSIPGLRMHRKSSQWLLRFLNRFLEK